jgi:hypothetical protein
MLPPQQAQVKRCKSGNLCFNVSQASGKTLPGQFLEEHKQ